MTLDKQAGWRLLFAVFAGLAAVLIIADTAIYQVERGFIRADVRAHVESTERLFKGVLEEQARLIKSQVDLASESKGLQAAWQTQQRSRLLQAARPLFRKIRTRYAITHFYFINADKTCFLRVHKPDLYGDTIERHTLNKAVSTAGTAHGIELGPLGTFTLRVVEPWTIEGELVGYLEMGRDVRRITPKLKEIVGTELIIALKKSFLPDYSRAADKRLQDMQVDWDAASDFVVTDHTMARVPAGLEAVLNTPHGGQPHALYELSEGDRRFYGGLVTLHDAGGRVVGEMAVLDDVTTATKSVRALLTAVTACGAVVGLVLLTLIFFYVKRAARNLAAVEGRMQEETAVRRQREEELNIFQSFAETAGQGFGMAHLDGSIVYVNSALCRLLGQEKDEIIGNSFSRYYPEHLQSKLAEEVIPTVLRDGQWWGELSLQPQEGESVPTLENLFLIRNKAGDPLYLADVVSDISEVKDVEEQLRQAKELAEAATLAKSEFLANISHEIRTPINGVVGMVELLLDTELNSSQREYLQIVKTSADTLLSIIRDTLDFSKIEARKLQLHPGAFRLRMQIQELRNLFALRIADKRLEFAVEIGADVPDALIGDAQRLLQVLVNLVGNAIKFTEEQGSIVLAVSVEQRDVDGVMLNFAVSDTGIGIDQQHLDRIFDSFFQVDTSSTRNFGGSGLGLAISSRLVEMQGGKLTVESSPGKGSVFSFTARFGLASEADLMLAEQTALDQEQQAAEPDPNPRKLRILLVEDNEVNQKVVIKLLQLDGHEVVLAEDGEAALQLWQEQEFDAILMDVQMPVMDGYQTTARIRQGEEGSQRHIPIIAMTAHAMAGDIEKCLSAGMDDYIAKPATRKAIREKLKANVPERGQ